MNPAHRLAAIGLGLSALFALAGVFALLVFLLLSHVSLLNALQSASEGIANSNDLATIKKISLMLVDAYREERASRFTIVWLGMGAMIGATTVTAAIYARLLVVLRVSQSDGLLAERTGQSALRLFMFRALNGSLKLWQSFWLIYVPFPILLALVLGGVYLSLDHLGLQRMPELGLVLWSLAASAICLAFFVASVMVWRCSKNTSWKLWTYIARVVVVLMIVVPLAKAVYLWGSILK